MVIRLKDTAKLFGITIIACCAVFVCTLFLSYNIDLAAIKDVITTEAGMAMYNAQVLMGKVIAAVSGGCLIATSVVMLLLKMAVWCTIRFSNVHVKFNLNNGC